MSHTTHKLLCANIALIGLGVLSGCQFDEGLIIENMQARVFVPEEAAQREFLREDGSVELVTDVALIGPVYLGLYASVLPEESVEAYPHPEVGPQYIEDTPGDTYPYGGTTIGDIRYACFEHFTCKMASGRFVDYDDIVEWFNNTLNDPIVDASQAPITTGEYIKQSCYALLDISRDSELRITAQDRNGDDKIDEKDLDFVDNGDGYYVADVTIWQQEYFDGFSLWGLMDAPSEVNYTFGTCDPSEGFQENEYANNFTSGRPWTDVLNQPAKYIERGDWVSEGLVWKDPADVPELYIDFEVQ
ncbi:MAG: hypothetical protein ACI8PZ_006707 [Myxococcota bacterium]|jgi:hypothetical protein